MHNLVPPWGFVEAKRGDGVDGVPAGRKVRGVERTGDIGDNLGMAKTIGRSELKGNPLSTMDAFIKREQKNWTYGIVENCL